MNIRYDYTRYLKLNMHGSFGYGLRTWLRTLYRNGFRIELLMLPKILWITTSILSMGVFRIYERVRYNARIRRVEVKDPVFIVGYSRSGTTYLHYLLSKDPALNYCATYQVLMPHIFLSMGLFLQAFFKKVLPSKRLMDNMKMGAGLPKEEEFAMAALSEASIVNGYYFPKNIMRYFKRYVLFDQGEKYKKEWQTNFLFYLKKVSYRTPEKTLLIKSPLNTGRIQEILELFPNARFIHIHRNPYEVYYSNEKLYESILPALAFHKVSDAEIERFILDSYRYTYQKYLRELSLIPAGNLTTLSYHELLKEPAVVLENVYQQLKLDSFDTAWPYISAELHAHRNYQPNKHSISDATDEKVFEAWKDIFASLGYAEKRFPLNKAV
jgi:hypothetical protein